VLRSFGSPTIWTPGTFRPPFQPPTRCWWRVRKKRATSVNVYDWHYNNSRRAPAFAAICPAGVGPAVPAGPPDRDPRGDFGAQVEACRRGRPPTFSKNPGRQGVRLAGGRWLPANIRRRTGDAARPMGRRNALVRTAGGSADRGGPALVGLAPVGWQIPSRHDRCCSTGAFRPAWVPFAVPYRTSTWAGPTGGRRVCQ